MKLSVVILNYNVRYFLELCLQSVVAALTDIDSEIIVVDNNSPDDSCAMVKQKFPQATLIENKENFGFSKGNNLGVAVAKGEYICILNPDTVVAEDSFLKLIDFAKDKKNLGIVGCQLIDGQGQFLPESKRHIPTPWVSTKKMLGLTDAYYATNVYKDNSAPVEILVGAFMFLHKAVYKEVSGFDEDYFMYGDDIDLSYKIHKKGYINWYFGDTKVIHYKGESTLKDKIYAKRFYGAMQIFYKKHFRAHPIFNIMVWVGIRLATWLQRPKPEQLPPSQEAILISNEKNEALEKALQSSMSLQKQVESCTANRLYILDTKHLSFKAIIRVMSNVPKNSKVRFKILPKNSNFILGSDSSKRQGEIVTY